MTVTGRQGARGEEAARQRGRESLASQPAVQEHIGHTGGEDFYIMTCMGASPRRPEPLWSGLCSNFAKQESGIWQAFVADVPTLWNLLSYA